jgi:hypothetical protein
MYLSHAVRTIRDDPMADESVSLVVTLAEDGDSGALGETVADLGGEVVADLRFSAVHVRRPETAVAALCACDGIDRVETAETLRLVGDEAADHDSGGTDETARTSERDRKR